MEAMKHWHTTRPELFHKKPYGRAGCDNQDLQKEMAMGNFENKLKPEDVSVHDWYRFVLSFPPHLVRQYIDSFGIGSHDIVLDPFCGTGTTNVECKKLGVRSWGIEASPITHFASKTKSTWVADVSTLVVEAECIVEKAKRQLDLANDFRGLTDEQNKLVLKNSISPEPLHQVLVLRDVIINERSVYNDYFIIALAKHIVYSYSNLKFGPEVGISRTKKDHVDVLGIWLSEIKRVERDLLENGQFANISTDIALGDARLVNCPKYLKSIDCVITSPPYPNEKDYSRTTRLESVILGFMRNREDLRSIKNGFIRSNSKNVYRNDSDERYVQDIHSINSLSEEIEKRRIDLGKTSGFEKLYASVVKLYFGGMAKHLLTIKPFLKDGACLAYVVGDQASYFQIPIRTSELLGEVAESIGDYKVDRIDTFRKRFATATESWLNEDVLVLKYKEK